MSSKWISRIQKKEGYVNPYSEYDPLDKVNCVRSPSPSLNWAFGVKGHGLPRGYSMLLGGEAKAGKTFIALNFVKELHAADPDAHVFMFNTEFRGEAQAGAATRKALGIDADRFHVFDTNAAGDIFDYIAKDINEMAQEGMKVGLIIIDSLSMIQGRRTANADTVNQQQIGDKAATLQAGLEMILPVVRRHRIAMINCTHVRDEMDMAEQMRGNKIKLQAANATKHLNEFFCMVQRNRSKDGRQDLEGNEFRDEAVQDAMGKGDLTGHKVRFKIMDSSLGRGAGRTGEFTLDFDRGIINQHEEIYNLGLNTGVITNAGATYYYGENNYRGKGAILKAIKEDAKLAEEILEKVYKMDE